MTKDAPSANRRWPAWRLLREFEGGLGERQIPEEAQGAQVGFLWALEGR